MAMDELVKPDISGEEQDNGLTFEEQAMCRSVVELWKHSEEFQLKAKELAAKQKRNSLAVREVKMEASKVRAQLAQTLFETKTKLGGKGRDSKFGAFLKQENMNRMQANRLIREHVSVTTQKCDPPASVENRELTPEAIDKLVKVLQSKCRSLTTQAGIDKVISKLTIVLQAHLLTADYYSSMWKGTPVEDVTHV